MFLKARVEYDSLLSTCIVASFVPSHCIQNNTSTPWVPCASWELRPVENHCKGNGHQIPGGGGVLRISSDGDDRMGAKIKTQKKSLDQKLTPKESHAELPSLKNFQKGLNDVIRKKTREIECLCLFIFIIPADFILSSSFSHSKNTRNTQEHLLFQQ